MSKKSKKVRTTSRSRTTRKQNKRSKRSKRSIKNTHNKLKGPLMLKDIPGFRYEAQNKNFINIVKKAHKNGIKKIKLDDGDVNKEYDVDKLMKKINKNDTKKLLKF